MAEFVTSSSGRGRRGGRDGGGGGGRRISRGRARRYIACRPALESFTEAQLSAIQSTAFQQQLTEAGLSINQIRDPGSASAGENNPYFSDKSKNFTKNMFELLLDGTLDKEEFDKYQKFIKMSMGDQLQNFMASQVLPPRNLGIRWQIVFDLLFLLRKEYPNCQVYAFGSLLTGFGDTDSDIDIYIDVHGDLSQQLQNDIRGNMAIREVQLNVEKCLKNAKCPHTGQNFVKRVVALGVHVLFIGMTHLKSLVSCDLTFNSPMSLNKTKLQLFYSNFSPVVRTFLVTLRYWAKFHNISGTNKLKNYGLTLLGLLHLMKIGLIPAPYLLQNLVDKKIDSDGWNYAFCKDLAIVSEHFRSAVQTTNLMEVLHGFFDMMAFTDFSKVVFCPFLGKVIERGSFLQGHDDQMRQFPEPFFTWIKTQTNLAEKLKMEESLFCLNDLFIHDFNVGGTVKAAMAFEKLQLASKLTVSVLKAKNNKLNDWTDLFQKMEMTHLEMEEKIKKEGGTVANEILQSVLIQLPSSQQPITTSKMQTKKYTMLKLHLDYDFKLMYLKELATCGILQSVKTDQRSKVMMDLSSLWKTFAMHFLDEIFGAGLQLNVIRVQERNVDLGEVNEGGSCIKPREWNMEMLSEQQFLRFKKRLHLQYPIHLKNLQEKILNLNPPGSDIQYKIFTLNIGYPFWNIENKLGGEDVKGKGETKNKATEYGGRNPIELEAESVQKTMQEFQAVEFGRDGQKRENFCPFTITLLVKLDARKISADSVTRPTLTLVIESSIENTTKEHAMTIDTLLKTLERSFPAYQTYKLSQWIGEIQQLGKANFENFEEEDDI